MDTDKYKIYIINERCNSFITDIDSDVTSQGAYYNRSGCCPKSILHEFLQEDHIETRIPSKFLFIKKDEFGFSSAERIMLKSKAQITEVMIVA